MNVLCVAGATVFRDLIWIELSTRLLGYTRGRNVSCHFAGTAADKIH